MPKTKNLGLELTTNDGTKFKDWREAINGEHEPNSESKSNMEIIDDFAAHIYGISGEVVLLLDDWDVNFSQQLTFEELGDGDAIFVSPADVTSKEFMEYASIFANTQKNIAIFTCKRKPKGDINLNYFISRGKTSDE